MPNIELKNIERSDYYYQEAIKTLRTNLQFCGSSIRVIMFTSTMPSEGKTETAFATAVAMSRIRKRVLFIDADIRKSMLVKTREIRGNHAGLSQYLSGQKTMDEIVCQTNVENLDLVLSGPYSPNPAELLEEKLFEELLCWARERYDYILIDTPPMMNIIDGAIIAGLSDGAVLLVDSGNISYRMAQRVKEQLEKSGCRILGAVLNRSGTRNSGGYYKKYYGKYYKKYGKYYDKYYDRPDRTDSENAVIEAAAAADPAKKANREKKAEDPAGTERINGCSRRKKERS